MAGAISSQGVLLQRGDGATTEVFTTVAEVASFSGPGGQTTIIDVSSFDSSFVEKLPGLPDEGQVTFECNFVPNNITQTGLRTDRAARTRRNFKLKFTPATPALVASFSGYVTGFQVGGSVNEKVSLSITIEIDGAVTWGTT